MALLRRRRSGGAAGGSAPATGDGTRVRGMEPAALAHLEQFVESRRGVEAYVEPPTTVSQMTVVLVAVDGEWTRRRIASGRDAGDLGRRLGIPVYDINATGYPPRMREWSARQK